MAEVKCIYYIIVSDWDYAGSWLISESHNETMTMESTTDIEDVPYTYTEYYYV